MQLVINGNAKEFDDNTTLQEIIGKLGLEGKVMAAALNMEIIKQDKWATCKPKDADKLELLDFVGGG